MDFFKLTLTSILLSLFITIVILSGVGNVSAADSPILPQVQPDPIIIGESYRWTITAQGGTQPYRFKLLSDLPTGLYLDSVDGVIFGTLQSCSGISTCQVKIQVEDKFHLGYWRIYTFNILYRTTIKSCGAQFNGEMDIYIDGKINGKLKSGQSITHCFTCGEYPQISVDDEVIFPTENNTKYRPLNNTISVNSSCPDAEFNYYREYLIKITTNPPQASAYFTDSSGWNQSSVWIREGDSIRKNAPLIVERDGIRYSFNHWLLPTYEQIDTNKLDWQVTRFGDLVACYETEYWLDTSMPFVTIEGGGWKSENTIANWVIKDYVAQLPPNIGALLGVYSVPAPIQGTEFMDKPKKVAIRWELECRPAIGSFIIALIITSLGNYCYNKRRRKTP